MSTSETTVPGVTEAIYECHTFLDRAYDAVHNFPEKVAKLTGETDTISSWLGILKDVCSSSFNLFTEMADHLEKIEVINLPAFEAQALRPDQLEIDYFLTRMQRLERIRLSLHTIMMESVAGRGGYEHTLILENEMYKMMMELDAFRQKMHVVLIAINLEILHIFEKQPGLSKPPQG